LYFIGSVVKEVNNKKHNNFSITIKALIISRLIPVIGLRRENENCEVKLNKNYL